MTSQPESRRPGCLRGPLVALAALGLALAAAEAVLRLAEREPTAEESAAAAVRMHVPDGKLTVWDPDLYYRLRPSSLLAGYYLINSQGYRGLGFTRAAPPGTLRIVCLGDSSTFGLTVAEDETWPAQLQRILAGLFEGLGQVEVFNAGVIGYSTEQNRRQLERELLPLRPDAVVICPTAQNDTTLRRGPPDQALLERNGSLWARLSQLRVARRLGLDFTPGRFAAAEDAARRELRPGQEGVRPRVPPERFTENLLAMIHACRDAGVPCILVATPHEPGRVALLPELGLSEERVVDAARRGRARLVDVRADFAAFAPLDLTSDEVHFTALGQQLVAIGVARALAREPPLLDAGARAPFLAAWAVATVQGVRPHEAPLTQGDVPPLLARILQAMGRPAPLPGFPDPAPAEMRAHDPLSGTEVGRPGLGATLVRRLRLGPGATEEAARLDRVAALLGEHVVPADGFLLRAGGAEGLGDGSDDAIALPRALTTFETAIGAVPPSVDLRRVAGMRALEAGDDAEAVRLFDAVLDLAPRLPEVLYLRGLALRRAGRHAEAQADFHAIVEIAPDSGLGLFVDGMLAVQAGEPERAEPSLRAALRLVPGHVGARTTLAQLLIDRGALDEAAALLDGAVILKADPAGVGALRAEIERRRAARDAPAGAAP